MREPGCHLPFPLSKDKTKTFKALSWLSFVVLELGRLQKLNSFNNGLRFVVWLGSNYGTHVRNDEEIRYGPCPFRAWFEQLATCDWLKLGFGDWLGLSYLLQKYTLEPKIQLACESDYGSSLQISCRRPPSTYLANLLSPSLHGSSPESSDPEECDLGTLIHPLTPIRMRLKSGRGKRYLVWTETIWMKDSVNNWAWALVD